MLKDITTIKTKGANFSSLTSFNLFDPVDNGKEKTVKATLLYGRNGTGKSTLARAFRKLKGEALPGILQSSIFDKDGEEIRLTDEEKNRIFVFDEDFVYRNVRLQEDHLDTIVMLGEAADLTEQIEKTENECKKAKNKYELQDAFYREYYDQNNPKSPSYYIKKIKNVLRGNDSWADRDRRIKENAKQNTIVKDDTYTKFVDLTPTKSKSELIMEFEEQIKVLKNARSGVSIIDADIAPFPGAYIEYDDVGLMKLLAERIERPELTEREKHLLRLVENGDSDGLVKRIVFFKQDITGKCPFCLQSVSEDYKEDLIASLEKVLSKDVENHQEKLQNRIFDEISFDLIPFEKLNAYKKCVELIDRINILIQANNELIQAKISNPYKPIVVEETEVADLAIQLDDALQELEIERKAYNKKSIETDDIEKDLSRINDEIAYYDVIDLVTQYNRQCEESSVEGKKNEELKRLWDNKKKEVESLEAQRRNVQIALDLINACMKYIFFAEDRLKIDYVDGVYKLLSHGKSVKPCDVSVGERNIIGLSYFFTRIMEGQEEKSVYNKEYLLVIDDPVSSYDTENRIGILSFLKYKLAEFLEGNEFTKALIMTHDLTTFYDVSKEVDEIIKVCKTKEYTNPPKYNRFELSEGKIDIFKMNRQEYTELIERIYKYARGEEEEQEIVIGNMMRQVLEAFSTFQYKKDIESVSTDDSILELLIEPEYISYYKNLMYRLVLHGGSHREEQIKSMQDFRFFSLISKIEKKKTARDVLCFIFLLNPKHLLVHLANCEDVNETFNGWCQEIKASAAVI